MAPSRSGSAPGTDPGPDGPGSGRDSGPNTCRDSDSGGARDDDPNTDSAANPDADTPAESVADSAATGHETDPVTGPDSDAADATTQTAPRDWRRIEPGLRRAWSALDVGKVALPVIVGTLVVSVPYVLVVAWVTEALLGVVDVLTPEVALGIVVFLTLTTFSSFLFSAVMLVDRLLPWESPLAL